VNPVPVALCRALGADSVIAVDLNAALLARRFRGEAEAPPPAPALPSGEPASRGVQQLWGELRQRFATTTEVPPGPPSPGLYDVLNNVLEIMQVRITRSRLIGGRLGALLNCVLAVASLLDRRARHAAERTEDAAIARARLKFSAAAFALVEEQARARWHRLTGKMAALWAGQDGFEFHGVRAA